MIQYICDLCKKPLTTVKVYTLPRRVQKMATNGHGVNLAVWDNIEDCETHLCPQCRCNITYIFDIVR